MRSAYITGLKTTAQKKKLKQLKEKQNKWVLDCLNRQKSKLQPYSSFKDKYLKYFVIGLPKKKRYYKKDKERDTGVESVHFQHFLTAKRQQVMTRQNHQICGVVRKEHSSQRSSSSEEEIEGRDQECSKENMEGNFPITIQKQQEQRNEGEEDKLSEGWAGEQEELEQPEQEEIEQECL